MNKTIVIRFTSKLFALLLFLIAAVLLQKMVFGSSLSPRGTKYEQHIAKQYSSWWQRTINALTRQDVLHFREPVHEEITNRMFGCEGGKSLCGDPDVEFAGPFVLAGVRFNDDPPFQLKPDEGKHTSCKVKETIRVTTQPVCWVQLFEAAKKAAAKRDVPDAYNHAPLLQRSHFGDLQFFHAMASRDGETAEETQKQVMMWEEFTWKVAIGTYSLDTKLQDVNIPGFDDFFGNSGWTVQDLFTVGNPALRPHISEVAFGSGLHTIEDSFAKGHTQREQSAGSPQSCAGFPQASAPPRIVEFHSYAHQDEKIHAAFDTRDAFEQESTEDNPSVVSVGKPLVKMFNDGASWEKVKPCFECIFSVIDPSTKASAGQEFVTHE